MFQIYFSVESNDTLYGTDPIFIDEVKGICNTLIGEILAYLKTLSAQEVRITSIYVSNCLKIVLYFLEFCRL